MKQFTKILIANRGEIAVRIIRTARKKGIRTVAVYTEADRMSLHVSQADEAVFLKGTSLDETYLNQQLLIRIAVEKKAEAIHPGYGFLAENASFAEAVAKATLVFIGPEPEQIRLMGEKNTAIELARSLNIPVLESVRGTKNELPEKAKEIGFPLMVKASAGGGGKGMFIVSSEDKLQTALDRAERQSIDYFNNGELFIEKYISNARHIEVQLLGDNHGNLIHLYERECSIQRRFQKIVEEVPSAFSDDDLRTKLCSAALKIGQAVAYRGLGTVEFLVDENGDFWFLEMNTRIQVEHPVTEAVTGIDLVEQQLSVAAGTPLQIKQSDIVLNGHAIEARICAEDVEKDFRPSTGVVEKLWFSKLAGLRTDTFIQEQTEIPPFYDSLLAKQIVHAPNREQAIDLLWHSLSETAFAGLQTNIPFLLQLLADSRFRKNEISTSFLNNFPFQHLENSVSMAAAYLFFHFFRHKKQAENLWQHIGFWRQNMHLTVWIDGRETEFGTLQHQKGIDIYFQDKKYSFEEAKWDDQKLELKIDGLAAVFFIQEKQSETRIFLLGKSYSVRSNLVHGQIRIEKKEKKLQKHFQQKIKSGLFGKVLSLEVTPGNQVEEGAVLLTIESMKTEFRILCPQTSIVKKVHVGAGEMIKDGQLLVELEEVTSRNVQLQLTVVKGETFTKT
ncbi:MAG: hypothetical protein A2W90_00470 [Bacteroidetes bacterium GWF2_42_66]|nr:MAG: hypothetical protein A2W92_18845 [Bacteroidetes bacterium GWA2_42_15]OFY02097.1 MAG: hypothetical protein A2W89_11655 [Bacteroidetes bacterium GWE2_42_39]OFY43444.1 MAG: hypothetical protein A2W90_00470 [Bacteroidetes bacterium GWF2_42_66]HBL76528.1 carbamoyl-phosphate synthase subunit L [Prolixibacteraceae bacterium]HCR92266.1 carbamoyl-phosphate synthase subunit L [Prolixibacteraceae bacterium]